jgi:hypothetical protein
MWRVYTIFTKNIFCSLCLSSSGSGRRRTGATLFISVSTHSQSRPGFRISGVLRKQAPFLKMYTEYINNHTRQRKAFEVAKKSNKRFQEMVAEIEAC